MDFESWWLLLLPLFFALGWVAARIDIRQLLSESRRLPASYFRGLNFLLNEQPDKAIEAFLEVVKIEKETVELHFALGSLFRRRGEIERAIRMHQAILEREDLGPEQQLLALYELAQDYLKAGLLDRAEECFAKLEGTSYEQQGLRYLLEIYEQEKDWHKAIAASRKMDAITGDSSARDIAHFYCELAAGELLHGRFDEARRYAGEALLVNRKCTRASMLQGDVELAAGDTAAAVEFWKRVEGQNPAYLSLLGDKFLAAYRKLDREAEGVQLLLGYLARYPSLDLLTVAHEAVRDSQGLPAAQALLREELRRTPSLIGLSRLVEGELTAAPAERRSDLELIRGLVQQHTGNLAQYKCERCGFRARQFYWHCPACHRWETTTPRRTEERELAA
ncbi:MAG: lipopolysaccharide assembly protein LapB [Betaproteobacteria bacterium]|nr:lipopolysaccharide assembly protein LapB [Rhodocyclaceae bacterium]MCA3135533.1 lipopolysaccharide assembly protein LapB [Rhodocyclaceae bacterium]MCA3143841.1 lipopolysaccharide assembly protein LapB [Rhodocyclaceae bacterium]MCA3146097.1 lipopolysaccharide assembly protein LapB [Rhodocyclaceae bacterium]MCE2897041.1 lipopolysaccharide assembly protein LapB [Betaproteobacteria bacterium]